MKIAQKFAAKVQDNWNAPGVTLAFLGDSVTQGCFEVYKKDDGGVETYFDKNSAYHAHLARMLAETFPNVPVNIVNAGVSGSNAVHGLERLERDVIARSPDLAVVCFALNDSCGGLEKLGVYTEALGKIFDRLQEAGIETVFMTPNMMCRNVSCHLSDELLRKIAADCARVQNEGILDAYVDTAKKVSAEHGVTVCDCYAKWKALDRAGADITELLANKINHPTRRMNKLFAYSLMETFFG